MTLNVCYLNEKFIKPVNEVKFLGCFFRIELNQAVNMNDKKMPRKRHHKKDRTLRPNRKKIGNKSKLPSRKEEVPDNENNQRQDVEDNIKLNQNVM